jgi:fructose-1,6-bisphosphatase/inositol monophosphatase family enzyme
MLKTAILAAREAGSILLDSLKEPRRTKVKGLRDIVTDADLMAQRAIIEIIQARFPNHDILSEEFDPGSRGQATVRSGSGELAFSTTLGPLDPSTLRQGSGHRTGDGQRSPDQAHPGDGQRSPDRARRPYTWIIDPLDGTTNYSRLLPFFCTSIALSYQGEAILGVVYDPLRDHLFQAEHGKGASLNGESLRVSQTESLADALVGLDWARAQEERKAIGPLVAKMALQVGTLRNLGAAALGLCYVAAGWLDAYFHFSLKPWDAAAGALIVQEAGGVASDFTGHPWQIGSSRCLASNDPLHEKIRSILAVGQANG